MNVDFVITSIVKVAPGVPKRRIAATVGGATNMAIRHNSPINTVTHGQCVATRNAAGRCVSGQAKAHLTPGTLVGAAQTFRPAAVFVSRTVFIVGGETQPPNSTRRRRPRQTQATPGNAEGNVPTGVTLLVVEASGGLGANGRFKSQPRLRPARSIAHVSKIIIGSLILLVGIQGIKLPNEAKRIIVGSAASVAI